MHALYPPSPSALDGRSGELGDNKGYMASLKAMLRVLVDPQSSKKCLIFEKNPNSPDPAPAYYFIDNHPGVIQERSCSQQSLPFPTETISCDQPWTNQCTGNPETLTDTPNRTSMTNGQTMKQDVCSWSDVLTSFDSEEHGLTSHGYTCLSMIQNQHHPTQHDGSLNALEDRSRHDDPATDTPVSADAFSDEETKHNIAPPGLVHPIPKPSLYMAANCFRSVSDTEVASDTTSPASSQECLPGVDRHGFHKTHWLNGHAGNAMLFQGQGSPGSSIATIDGSYTPFVSTCSAATPLYWPNSGIPVSWEMQSQDAELREANWASMRCFSGTNYQGRHIGGEPHLSAHPMDNNYALPSLNDSQHYPQQPPLFVHALRPHSHGSTNDKEQSTVDQALSPLQFVNNEIMYHQSGYEIVPSIHPGIPSNAALPYQGRANPRSIPCHSETRNAFLIECKRRGLSYKDIKRLGGFKEAESTLRGRFRTLTKSKEQRVRKPQWKEKDIKLLCEAVNACSSSGKQASNTFTSSCRPRGMGLPPKVSWKKVAQYIWTHGGSYHFGNATCKKKWCEVHNVKI